MSSISPHPTTLFGLFAVLLPNGSYRFLLQCTSVATGQLTNPRNLCKRQIGVLWPIHQTQLSSDLIRKHNMIQELNTLRN